MSKAYVTAVALLLSVLQTTVSAATLSAREVLDKALESNPFALSEGRVEARVILRDKRGVESTLAFTALSHRYDPPFSKSVGRFRAPAELRGAGFLQVQKRAGDDDRFLFLPEIKRARRISGKLRQTSFMGTDFSYADLDRRDLREGSASSLADALVGGAACHGIEVRPATKESEYSRVELWIRKDSLLPVRMKMYDRAGTLLKTFVAESITKVQGHWFVARSKVTNHKHEHSTTLFLEKIVVDPEISEQEFTVQALERI